MSAVRRLWWTVRTTTRNLWSGRISATLAAGSIALAIVLTSASLLIGSQAERLRDHWTGRADVTVYLCTRASAAARCSGVSTAEQITAQRIVIAGHPDVAEYWFEDRASAWTAFTERFSDSSILESLDANAVPESYRIKLLPGVDRGDFVTGIVDALEDVGGYELVQDQREALSGFFSVAERIRTGALLLAVLQSSISLALLAHLLRASVAKRHKDIRVMGLVGTPNRQIRAPFMFEALVVYTAGVIAASATVLAGLGVVRTVLERAGGSGAILVTNDAALGYAVTIYLTGLVLGWVTVRLTLRTRIRETH